MDDWDVASEKQQLNDTITFILECAQKGGATDCSVAVSKVSGLSTTVRNQDIETLEFNQDCGFGITAYVNKSKGSASTSDTSKASIERTVSAAIHIAQQTSQDPHAGLADKALMATDLRDLALDHPMGISVAKASDLAYETEQAMLDAGCASDGVTFASHRSIHAYGNSHGFQANHCTSRHMTSAVGIASNEQGMQRDYYYTIARHPETLVSPQLVGKKAAQRTLSRLGSRAIKTGHYPILLNADIAAGFIGHIMSAIQGGKLYRKASFLTDHLGKQILPEFVTIDERPYLKGALSSRCYDGEGVQTREQSFVAAGELTSYILSSYSARRLSLETTANAGGTHNLFVSSTGESQQDLIVNMKKGLLITEVMGQGVNLVTGDYSRGASGFWIEDGEIKHPVEGITIAGNLKDMMLGISNIGNDREHYLSTQTGSILIDSMMVAAN
ncbi:MAG: metalloprotease PmbA [Gammaproteobacteria bacterium]|nr:metalloprotease PmbA [Gammaproteobacteria bacterium]NNJ72313.1 metalloprotease PmbA [Enterobacterales bacterium]